MTKVHYTSDLHIGHAMVAGLRGFSSTDEHDEAIRDAWRASVDKRDVVYVLGDLTLQNPARVVEYVQSLPGRKHFISGNHDRVHPMFRDWHKVLPVFLQMFESVTPFARRRAGNTNVLLSHFPYGQDHTLNPRFDQYRLRDCGEWLIHGHLHSDSRVTGEREIHVGVDAWGLRPASEPEVIALMEGS